jgi:hypothetical protein
MDGYEISEAIVRETSSGGGKGNVSFKGCWPQFAKDHNLHQGWFLIFNYHRGT